MMILPARGPHSPPATMPEVVGVFIGGCVERGIGSSFRRRAHAHIYGTDEGWICFRSPKRVFQHDGRTPSRILMHEYAHVLSLSGHTDKWRATMRTLRQPIPHRYQKRLRVRRQPGSARLKEAGAR